MRQMAEVLLKSGFLPATIKTPEAAVAVILKGTELGIPPMYALSNVVIIQGKPTANAELMLALIYRDHGDNAAQFIETNADICTISYARRGWDVRRQHSYTIAEAKAAGLIKNGPWTSYPAAMLRARCISAVARLAFPDTIAGMYTAEELGAQVTVNTEGEVETVAVPEPVQTARIAPVAVARPVRPNMAQPMDITELWAAAKESGWSAGDVADQMLRQYPDAVGTDGKPSTRDLTRDQIRDLIALIRTPVEAEDAPVTEDDIELSDDDRLLYEASSNGIALPLQGI